MACLMLGWQINCESLGNFVSVCVPNELAVVVALELINNSVWRQAPESPGSIGRLDNRRGLKDCGAADGLQTSNQN